MTTDKPVVGHIVVNGKDLCETDYPGAYQNPDDINGPRLHVTCSCMQADGELFIRALKAAYPDGSGNQVHWAKWYPTSCTRGERGAPIITREYICLALFKRALDTLTGGMTDGFKYTIDKPKRPAPSRPELPCLITFTFDRYAMDGSGFHVGYETFKGTAVCIRKRTVELNSMQVALDKDAEWMVDLATLDAKLESAPDAYEPECYCDGGYEPPDDDFVWQEVEHRFTQAREYPIAWSFDRDAGKWSIVNYVTGEVLL